MERFSASLFALSLLVSCAAAPSPPMTADNPANPSAPEATVHPLHNALETDSLTRKSRHILAQSAREQQTGGQSGPAPQQPMPGMEMPPE